MKKVEIELDSLKQIFKDIFGSSNYFDLEIPKSYKRDIKNDVWPEYSKYDRCIAWYESNWWLARLLWQILTVIDASVEQDKKEHVKSIIKQLYYPWVRRLNDDMFDFINRELNK